MWGIRPGWLPPFDLSSLLQAKLGNSSVSPNVGHLVLKYLCPAIRDVLSDGLKAYVLDVIVGQRRNVPWSIVEASTQLGRELWDPAFRPPAPPGSIRTLKAAFCWEAQSGPPRVACSPSRPGKAPVSFPALPSPCLLGLQA